MICFYHRADLDGRCSGAIVKRAFPDCEMVGIDYGEPFPWHLLDEGNHKYVWMVDFSLQPFSEMVKLDKLCYLTWIDHHKSAISDYNQGDPEDGPPLRATVELDCNFAACELVWRYISRHEMLAERSVPRSMQQTGLPESVFMLGRYDIWKHEGITGCLEFQYGARAWIDSQPEAPIWDEVFRPDFSVGRVINDGVTLLAYERNQNAAFCSAYAFECELDGLKCIAANRGMSNSLLFESVYDPAKHHAMLMFAWKGASWTVSLYSTHPDVDVSEVCKARGGGGHKGAAGFQCDELPFLPRKRAAIERLREEVGK